MVKKLVQENLRKMTNHQHIGRVSSTTNLPTVPEVLEAQKAFNNREKLQKIDKALSEIEKILSEFK